MRVHSPVEPKSLALAMAMKPRRAASFASAGIASSRLPRTTSTCGSVPASWRGPSRCAAVRSGSCARAAPAAREGLGRAGGERLEETTRHLPCPPPPPPPPGGAGRRRHRPPGRPRAPGPPPRTPPSPRPTPPQHPPPPPPPPPRCPTWSGFSICSPLLRTDRPRLLLREGRPAAGGGARLDAVLPDLRRAALPLLSAHRRQAARPAANWPFILATTISHLLRLRALVRSRMWHTRDVPQSVMQGVAGVLFEHRLYGPAAHPLGARPAASAPVALIFVFDNLLPVLDRPPPDGGGGVEKRSLPATIADIVWKVVTHPFNIATAAGVAASYLHLQSAGGPRPDGDLALRGGGALRPLPPRRHRRALRPLGPIPGEVPALVFIKLILHPLLVLGLLSAIGDFGNLDLCGRDHGGAAAGSEHLRDLDAVQCRRRARLGLRPHRHPGLDGDAHGLPLSHQDGQDAPRSIPVTGSRGRAHM